MATLDTRLTRLEHRLRPPEPPTIERWGPSDTGGYFCFTTGEELTAGEFEAKYPDAFTIDIDRATLAPAPLGEVTSPCD